MTTFYWKFPKVVSVLQVFLNSDKQNSTPAPHWQLVCYVLIFCFFLSQVLVPSGSMAISPLPFRKHSTHIQIPGLRNFTWYFSYIFPLLNLLKQKWWPNFCLEYLLHHSYTKHLKTNNFSNKHHPFQQLCCNNTKHVYFC